MKIKELINYGINNLNKNNIEDSNIKAKILLKYILKQNNSYLTIHWDEDVKVEDETKYKKGIEELTQGKPIQYIINHQEFMGLDFYVDESVLIPQPDTEILVEEVLKEIQKHIKNSEKIRILDLCTGSGAIAISIAKYLQENISNVQVNKTNIDQIESEMQFEIYASDISSKALDIAKKNAETNNVEIHFILSDMFENIKEKFDIIVSNPPYIQTDVIGTLSSEVQHEPYIALDGGKDGLMFYKVIVDKAYEYLNKDGYIFLEIGYDQKESLMNLFKENNQYQFINCIKDLGGNDRVIIAKKV